MLATLILTTVLITPIGTWQAEPPRLLTIESLTTYLANRQVVEEPIVLPVQHRYRNAVGVERWRSLVEKYFRPKDVEWALGVMSCESGGNPNAKNAHSSASGLFQHLARYWPERSVKAGWGGASIWDPEANIAVAAWLLDKAGKGSWVCKG